MSSYLACNQYAWFTFYKRMGMEWRDELDRGLGEMAAAGFTGFEPSVTSPAEVRQLAPLLEKHGLAMQSLYVNSTLHREDAVDASIAQALAIADAAAPLGVRTVVTNPDPIRWGGPEDKDDIQLQRQAAALDRLGAALRDRGLTLGYHTHDPELRQGARELHHMLLATDPDNVSFCLDPHWIYRGAGDSQVALFDIVKLYGHRIVELHLRQSHGGVWSEVFEPGDIDYGRLAVQLRDLGVTPLLVLEQCIEAATPDTLDVVTAHRQGIDYLRTVDFPVGF